MKPRILVVGNGGREASVVNKLSEDCIIYSVVRHENPTIVKAVESTGGNFIVGDPLDGKLVSEFALSCEVNLAFVNSDEALAAGVVDELLRNGVPTFGPTRDGAKIEWSKVYTRRLVNEVDSRLNPNYVVFDNLKDLSEWFSQPTFSQLVVKPDGLTGGKGVKVMGKHLNGIDEARDYAESILLQEGIVLIEEKISGYEFTIMGITDGTMVVFAPATFDYPYRFDNDTGPGTGGMGCFTSEDGLLPFLSELDIIKCKFLMEKVVKKMNENGRIFNGVLNGGFFKREDGEIILMEFNSRFGDPECLNIMALFETPLVECIQACIEQTLDHTKVKFKRQASVVVYLVSKGYALDNGESSAVFAIHEGALKLEGAEVSFASCIHSGLDDTYKSVGYSRLAGVSMVGLTLQETREKLYRLIETHVSGSVEWRTDIGAIQSGWRRE